MPRLEPGMARIRVKDLCLRTFIGINEDEILNKQDVLINLTTGPGGRFVPDANDPKIYAPGTTLVPPEKRVEHIAIIKPDICSLDLNTMNSGADVVINPAEHSPFASWKEYGHIGGLAQLMEMGVSTREKLGRLPGPWWHVWRMAEMAGLGPKRPVIFECVGVPGLLNHLLDGAPVMSRIVVDRKSTRLNSSH